MDLTPTPPVTSVAGRTGAVVLTAADVSGLLTATSGTAVLAANVNLSSTSFVGVGLSVSLPAAGTYLIVADVRSFNVALDAGSGAAYLEARLYNTTDSAAVPASLRMPMLTFTQNTQATSSLSVIVTVAGPKTIDLQARNGSGTNGVASDADGSTTLCFVRLA